MLHVQYTGRRAANDRKWWERGGETVRPARAIALGGLTVGALDGLDAIIFFGLRGVPAQRIFQGIATGLLGPGARQGGIATVLLGVGIHFLIATVIVAVYCLASRQLPLLRCRVLLWGPLYGILAYLFMNEVVITLRFGQQPLPPLPVLLNGVLIHIVGVGLPSALFARGIDWKGSGVRDSGSGVGDQGSTAQR